MPWPVYSETFVRALGQDTTTIYTVPSGHRAVVKSVSSVQLSGALATVEVVVANVYLAYAVFQAVGQVQAVSTMTVAYAGQQIKVIIRAGNAHSQVSGYLFKNPPTGSDDPPDVERRRNIDAEPLPAAE